MGAMFRSCFSVLCACAILWGAPETDRAAADLALLEKVRIKMVQNLMHLPNYTCLQTIERTQRRSPSRRFQLIDMIRIEVALVNGRELFSWPGAGKFDEKEINEMVTGGAIGNGNFALHAKSVFQGSPQFKYIGEESISGRKLLRWDYRVPLLSSGFRIRVGTKEATVAFHGSFWADPATLDVTRLEVEADDIPLDLHLLRTGNSVDYQRTDIGGASFLLPRSSELRMIDDDNTESVNSITFTSCHQYLGESKLIFSDPEESSKPVTKQVETIVVPEDLTMNLALETPIRSGVTAVGDPVSFILKKDLKRDGVIYFEKGAVVHGRITLLRKHQMLGEGWAIGIQLHEIQSPVKHAVIQAARIEGVSAIDFNAGLRSSAGSPRQRVVEALPRAPGSVFFVRGTTLVLARGTPMFWRTERITTNGDTQ
jgi:hypothetical protein